MNQDEQNKQIKNIILQNFNSFIPKIYIEEECKRDPKYKTELCKKFEETGKCPYGFKCRFAHGKEELMNKIQGVNYKKKPCKSFNEKGFCPYGKRCSFQHDERKYENINFSYYYFQLFILKISNNKKLFEKIYQKKQEDLFDNRLPVFSKLLEDKDIMSSPLNFEKKFQTINERTSSMSTASIDENDKKIGNIMEGNQENENLPNFQKYINSKDLHNNQQSNNELNKNLLQNFDVNAFKQSFLNIIANKENLDLNILDFKNCMY